MLNNMLEGQKNMLIKKVEEYELLVAKRDELLDKISESDQEIANIERKLEDKKREISELATSKKQNKFVEFIKKHFSKKHKEAMCKGQKLQSETWELRKLGKTLLEEKRSFINDCDNLEHRIKSYGIDKIRGCLMEQEDREKAILMLLKLDPQLRENPQFMTELVDEAAHYITYDKTNNPDVYLRFGDKFMAERKDDINFDRSWLEEDITNFKREINAPKKPEEGKYKIPQKYLFEMIRAQMSGEMKSNIVGFVIQDYQELDGTLPEEYGKKIQEMYEDPKSYFLQHIVNLNAVPEETVKKRIASILKNGLACSGHNESHVSKLGTTTIGNHQADMTFLTALSPRDKIIMMLPKQAIDRKHEIPVWGADTPTIDHIGGQRNYVLPEYVVGYIDPKKQQFMANEIPENERKKYPYKFFEGEKETIEDRGMER